MQCLNIKLNQQCQKHRNARLNHNLLGRKNLLKKGALNLYQDLHLVLYQDLEQKRIALGLAIEVLVHGRPIAFRAQERVPLLKPEEKQHLSQTPVIHTGMEERVPRRTEE